MTLTWNWDDVGRFADINPTDICHTIEHPYGGGYCASRPENSKMQKEFEISMLAMTSAEWLNLVEFWRSVKGNGDAFYFQFPIEIYGSPGYGGYGGLEPSDGFDADQAVGYGEGPILTVRFVGNKLHQKQHSEIPFHWQANFILREVA